MRLGYCASSTKFCSVRDWNGLIPSPQRLTNARSSTPASGRNTVTVSQSRIKPSAEPPPATETQRARLRALAAHSHVTLGHAQQKALQIDQRQGHHADGDDHHRHELIGRRAEQVGQLEQIGREHQHVGGIAEDQRQAEQFEAEEEDQHAAVDQRRPGERQAHRERDPPGRRTDDARGLLQFGVQLTQRGGGEQIDVRHMRETRRSRSGSTANRDSTARSRVAI